jgi:hypothetical protein
MRCSDGVLTTALSDHTRVKRSDRVLTTARPAKTNVNSIRWSFRLEQRAAEEAFRGLGRIVAFRHLLIHFLPDLLT